MADPKISGTDLSYIRDLAMYREEKEFEAELRKQVIYHIFNFNREYPLLSLIFLDPLPNVHTNCFIYL